METIACVRHKLYSKSADEDEEMAPCVDLRGPSMVLLPPLLGHNLTAGHKKLRPGSRRLSWGRRPVSRLNFARWTEAFSKPPVIWGNKYTSCIYFSSWPPLPSTTWRQKTEWLFDAIHSDHLQDTEKGRGQYSIDLEWQTEGAQHTFKAPVPAYNLVGVTIYSTQATSSTAAHQLLWQVLPTCHIWPLHVNTSLTDLRSLCPLW